MIVSVDGCDPQSACDREDVLHLRYLHAYANESVRVCAHVNASRHHAHARANARVNAHVCVVRRSYPLLQSMCRRS